MLNRFPTINDYSSIVKPSRRPSLTPTSTSDNPRTEDPVQIVKDVEVGVKEGLREGSHYEVIV